MTWHELVSDWPVWCITVPAILVLFGIPLYSAWSNRDEE